MPERTLDLCSEADAHGGTRSVWLRLTENGALILEGQDLGPGVSDFFGEAVSEYEWAWKLPPDGLRLLLDSLRVAAGSPDLLEQVARRLKVLNGSQMQKRFEQAGATFWSRVGE